MQAMHLTELNTPSNGDKARVQWIAFIFPLHLAMTKKSPEMAFRP